MGDILKEIEIIEDVRQQGKIKHKLMDIVAIVLFATLANADDWIEIAMFAECHEEFLKNYIELAGGIPSHDTIQRVMGSIEPQQMQKLYEKWNDFVNTDEGEKLKRIICIDGKTMRGNKTNGGKPNHIVSAWCDEAGFCLGQRAVEEKSSEVTAIPKLLKALNIKGSVVTIDAMGTQTEIADTIKNCKADYVLAVKGNQGNLLAEISEFFDDNDFLDKVKKDGGYKRTIEKSHSQIEKREYYQCAKINWMAEKCRWNKLKSIGMVRKTITKNEVTIVEKRYYISSLPLNIELFSRAVRQHWSVEIMHWHLDVTFKEDANETLDKVAAQNLNIIRKWCLSILKIFEIGNKKMSLTKKRFCIAMKTKKYIEEIMNM